MSTNTSNTPCPIPRCPHDRYPHALLCWDHLCALPDPLRTALEAVWPPTAPARPISRRPNGRCTGSTGRVRPNYVYRVDSPDSTKKGVNMLHYVYDTVLEHLARVLATLPFGW